ncbi:MAG: perosamine synthetase [Clostridia bacterium]|nr:perosamine synthetase [Clostridia bacterium]
MKIELDAPNLGQLEKKKLLEAIDLNFISTAGPFVAEFEEKFAKYVGAKYAISTQSGTAALHISLYELGIGPGDEVILPVLTFVATVNPILYVGATPVFADVDRETWNINPEEIRKVISTKTKAIILVHLYGNPCQMDEIMDIANEHGLYVIEDATESLGATFKGKMTGTFGDIGCFSFNGNKVITTGGGGMVVTDNKEKADHIKFLVNQARDNSKGYYHPELGFNYRMTNLEAALGLAQLKKVDEFISKKRQFAKIYQQELSSIKGICFQQEYPKAQSNFWLTSVTIEDLPISKLQKTLQKYSPAIPSRRIFMPLSEFPYLRQYAKDTYTNAYEIYNKGINLPSSTLNDINAIFTTAKVLRECKISGESLPK